MLPRFFVLDQHDPPEGACAQRLQPLKLVQRRSVLGKKQKKKNKNHDTKTPHTDCTIHIKTEQTAGSLTDRRIQLINMPFPIQTHLQGQKRTKNKSHSCTSALVQKMAPQLCYTRDNVQSSAWILVLIRSRSSSRFNWTFFFSLHS